MKALRLTDPRFCLRHHRSSHSPIPSDLQRDTAPQVPDADYAALVAGDTGFAVSDLLHQVQSTERQPVLLAAQHLAGARDDLRGANGATATQMAQARTPRCRPATLHAAMDRARPRAAVARAAWPEHETKPFSAPRRDASIWGQTGATFEQPFLDTLAVDYGAGPPRPRLPPAVLDARHFTINDWVATIVRTTRSRTSVRGPGRTALRGSSSRTRSTSPRRGRIRSRRRPPPTAPSRPRRDR